MKVIVKSLIGKINCKSIEINAKDTVKNIIVNSGFYDNIPLKYQKIYWNTQMLEHSKLITEYDIQENDILYIMFQLRWWEYD